MKSPEQSSQPEQKPEQNRLRKQAHNLLLIAALGAGGQILDDTRSSLEFVGNKPLDKNALNNLYDLEWDFPSQDQNYVAFLPQIHGFRDLKSMDANKPLQEIVIQSQKHCVAALVRMGVQKVYWEGITAKWEQWFAEYAKTIKNFRTGLAQRNFKEVAEWLDKEIVNVENKVREGKIIDERVLAWNELYFLHRFDEFFDAIKAEKTNIDATLLEKLGKIRQALSESPRLKDDKRYLWGAPALLWARGAIEIGAGEDPALLNAATIASSRLLEKKKAGTLTEEDINLCITAQNQREDFALQMSLKDPSGKKGERRAIQFGSSHDFYRNFQAMLSEGKTGTFGLLQLIDCEQSQFDAVIHQNTSDLIDASFAKDFLKDAR